MEPSLHAALVSALSRPDVTVAVLFGSHARGAARADSDVDVAILGTADPIALSSDLSRVLGRDVDVVQLDTPNVPLLDAIVHEGVLLMEAMPGAYASWRSRALATLETDRPNWVRMRDAWLARVAERGL